MNALPLLVTLTGDESTTLSGRKKKKFHFGKGLVKFARVARWAVAPGASAAYVGIKALKKKQAKTRAKKRATAARQRQAELETRKAAAVENAAANPTPENKTTAQAATIQAAAATAAANTADSEAVKAENETAEDQATSEAQADENEPAAENPATDEGAPAEETPAAEPAAEETAETAGAARPPRSRALVPGVPKLPAIPAEGKITPIDWMKKNKVQTGILAAALAVGIFYTVKQHKKKG